MDGYAVRLSDIRTEKALPVAGKAFARQPFNDAWPVGTCIRIMTGAPVPEGCDAVVMQEETQANEESITFNAPVKAGQTFCLRKAEEQLVLWPARQSGIGYSHLLSAGSPATGSVKRSHAPNTDAPARPCRITL